MVSCRHDQFDTNATPIPGHCDPVNAALSCAADPGANATARRAGRPRPPALNSTGAYNVLGVGPRRSPLEVYGKRPLSHFVGRERELAVLQDLLAQVDCSRCKQPCNLYGM